MGRLFSWVATIFLLLPHWVSGQNVETEFGKNRIQYHDDFDKWDMYETENFVTYWYGKGREIAHTVVQLAELDNPSIQNILEHKMNDKIELIVYLDLTDMKQSNLGIEEQFINRGGITKVVENKVFLYFNGDHNDLRKSLREGIASVYISSMLHGNNLQEIVQNAVLLNLPDWFQEGLVSYMGEEWSPEIESRLKDYFTNPKKKNKKKDFVRLAKEDPRLAGHSMWNFLANYYGRASISNLLYLTRINRSLENGLLYVLGIDTKELTRQWQDYYQKKFNEQNQSVAEFRHDLDLLRQKQNIPLGKMRFSPDGKKLAYALNDHSRVRVFMYDMETGNKDVLLRYGVRNFEQEADLNYPLIAWRPDGNGLSLIYEKRDVIYQMSFDFPSKMVYTDRVSPEYHRIYDMDYWSSDTLAFSASTDGLSDLYLYAPATRQSIRLTEDFHDDLDPSVAVIDGQRYILFSSNRTSEVLEKMELDSLLPIGPFDLYLFHYDQQNSSLRRLTYTKDASERQARIAGPDELISLSDKNGRWQRIKVSRLMEDPPLTTVMARYDRDILQHEYVPASPVVVEWLRQWNQPYIQATPIDSKLILENGSSSANDKRVGLREDERIAIEEQQEIEAEDPKYHFQTSFPEPPALPNTADSESAESVADESYEELPEESSFAVQASSMSYDPKDLVEFSRSRIIAARLKFKLDYLNTTMDNDLLFGGLDSYAGTKREFEPSPLGLLIKGSVKDLLEDYIITGGARFPTTFNGSEYFLVFDNRKRRIDRTYAIYRKSSIEQDPQDNNPNHRNQYVSVLGLVKFSYPFDVYNSLRLSGTIRNDRVITLSTDLGTLSRKTDDAQRFGLKLEWVYDNTRILDINNRRGTRAKAWTEVVKRFDLNLFEAGPKLQFNKGFMTVLGFDARHYVSLDRRSLIAVRGTGATSFGSERILYYLGGVENWLFPSFDKGISVPNDINFAYTALAANMRGFKYNARNGSSVVLANAELRVPVLQYLSRQKIRSSFLRNFQVVGFIDAGTAWHGSDPFGPNNPLNTVVLTNPPTVEVIVNYYRNPLIVGYGAGVRTMLFGYLLKLDYGWNWETKTNRKPLLHFSMGADF